MEIWQKIVESNTFNFAVMVLIIAFIAIKANLGQVLENGRNKVIETIEKAKRERESSLTELKNAKKSIENIEEEIHDRLHTAKTQGKTLAQKIIEESVQKIKEIEVRMERIIKTEEKTIAERLIKNTGKNSIQSAKSKIIETLKNNPELHKKYIEKSIEEIGKL